MKRYLFALLAVQLAASAASESLQWEGREFELSAVKASVTRLNGEDVLKVERDLRALPFDAANLGRTVDEPTFVKVKGLD